MIQIIKFYIIFSNGIIYLRFLLFINLVVFLNIKFINY